VADKRVGALLHSALLPDALNPQAEMQRLADLQSGGLASFTGHVRPDDGVTALFLEHHPVMTQQQLAELVAEAASRWPLDGALAVHRIGRVERGDAIVCVAAAAAHRVDALAACTFLIDQLKTTIALWKQEILLDGAQRWVDPRSEDHNRSAAWARGDSEAF
jgi:molybdopterin synthase catalytic subunit